MDKQLIKSLARLTALKNNVPQKGYGVLEKYVDEFNTIIGELEKSSGEDLSEFKIPDNEVGPRVTSVDMTGRKTYSSGSYCDREFISMKIDGVLGYFTFLLQPNEIKDELGFKLKKR